MAIEEMLPAEAVPVTGTENAAEMGERLEQKLARYSRALSRQLVEQIKCMYQAFRDPAVPRQAKLIVFAALGYFILPTDALPDFLPMLGFTDDAAVIAMALRNLQKIIAVHRAREASANKASALAEREELRLELALAMRRCRRLEAESRKWRRVAKVLTGLCILQTAFMIWLLLSG